MWKPLCHPPRPLDWREPLLFGHELPCVYFPGDLHRLFLGNRGTFRCHGPPGSFFDESLFDEHLFGDNRGFTRYGRSFTDQGCAPAVAAVGAAATTKSPASPIPVNP